MNGQGFRQTNAWLHTWTGLLLGWLLYAVFFTGTISFFRDEINFWMKPEQHASRADADTAQRVLDAMQARAPNASSWSITLPTERYPAASVQWYEQGERPTRGGGHRLALDAATAEPIALRETRGADFLYRFHFELHGMPRIWGRWIVGVATMVMLVAIVSGVITHKKIFADFFTFRRRKGQRSWMDAHNALAVLALPFHLMITYSGLLLLMYLLMPWAIETAYQGDSRAYFAEQRGGRVETPATTQAEPVRLPSGMADVGPMLAQARAQWPSGIGSISVTQPNTTQAVIELRERGGDSLLDRGRGERMRFDGASGARLDMPLEAATDGASAVYNVFSSLHLLRFSGPWLRWLSFIAGVLGTAMIATGMVLWVVKRLPQRRKTGTHFGHRLVECLNVGTIAGLPLALAGYFWANRLLPVQMAGRSDWEIRIFFVTWLICLIHPVLRSHRRAWLEQLSATAVLFALLPLFSFYLPHSHLVASLGAGQWVVAGMDLTLLALAALAALGAWYMRSASPVAKAAAAKPARAAVQGARA